VVCRTAEIDEREVCARRRQLERDSAADSPRRAGDDCILALEFHPIFSLLCVLSSTTAADGGKRASGVYSNAFSPVMSRPRINVCTSKVPS